MNNAEKCRKLNQRRMQLDEEYKQLDQRLRQMDEEYKQIDEKLTFYKCQ